MIQLTFWVLWYVLFYKWNTKKGLINNFTIHSLIKKYKKLSLFSAGCSPQFMVHQENARSLMASYPLIRNVLICIVWRNSVLITPGLTFTNIVSPTSHWSNATYSWNPLSWTLIRGSRHWLTKKLYPRENDLSSRQQNLT